MKGIIGRKVGMTQIFDGEGGVIPVTVIQAGPCHVVQRKSRDVDGYEAVQLGFEEVKPTKLNKPRSGHFKKHGVPPCRVLREFRVEDSSSFTPGQQITVEIFRVGEKIKVTGWSKGRGFTGVVKRHGFSGAPGSHGTHEYFRHGGSIGAAADPARVFKGKRMAGRYGGERVTVRNLKVVDVRPEHNLLLVKGAVPGPRGGLLILRGEGEFPAAEKGGGPSTPEGESSSA
jgi:large subunit ribosomal protein L3